MGLAVHFAGLSAEPKATLIASSESGWPQWRGLRRDGISHETNLLQQWPQAGPPLLWKISGLGRGYSSPIINSNRLYITGEIGNDLRIFALDSQGQKVWQNTNGAAWKGQYPGARACCAFRDGRLFHLNAHGRVACFDAASGRELWSLSLVERFGGRVNTWAYSECLLVDGTNLIVTPGGTQALAAALDIKTGQTVWKTEPLLMGGTDEQVGTPDRPSYASPILVQFGPTRMIVDCSQRHVFAVDAVNGRLLWNRPLRTRYSVIAATPLLVNNAIFATAPDTDDARLYALLPGDNGVSVQELWSTTLDTCHGCTLYLPTHDAIFGSWYRLHKGLACLDPANGKVRYRSDAMAKGSAIFADNRLYYLSEEGDMALLELTASAFEFKGRFRLVPERQSDVWAHPVLLDGKLYLRCHENLFCYDVKRGN